MVLFETIADDFFDAIAPQPHTYTTRELNVFRRQGKHERKVAYPAVERQAVRHVQHAHFANCANRAYANSASYFISGEIDTLAKAIFAMVERLIERSIAAEIH